MRGRVRILLALVAVLGLAGCAISGDEPDALLVAGASDLRPAFEELGERFTADTGTEVVFDFGSSGQIAQRIIEGQDVDLYASASARFVDEVLSAGVGDADTRTTYAFGRVVLWSRADRWAGWDSLEAVAADPEVLTVAIANPEHAPYGTAGQEALQAAGVLDAVADRLVLGENIADAQRLVATGNADVGIIALSLALAADERGEGEWLLLDAELHAPLQQDLVVTAREPQRATDARAFADLVASPVGREVMERFGFLDPGQDVTP